MNREVFFRQFAGRYRLTRFVVGGNDLSEMITKGWENKSLYMIFEITEDGQFKMKAHRGAEEKEYEYYPDPAAMRYHLKADLSDEGTPFTIENGVFREETKDHIMVYELID